MITRVATLLFVVSFAAAAPSAELQPGGVDDAIVALFQAARSGNELALNKAAAAVVAFGSEASPRLAGSLSDRTPVELVWALKCLREIGSDSGKDVAFSLCTHSNPQVRAEAVWTARTLGGTSSVPFLLRAAADSDDTVRRRAFDGILEHGCGVEGSLAVAVKGVLDQDLWVVLAAVQILDRQPVPKPGYLDPVLRELGRIVDRLDDRNSRAVFDLLVRRGGSASGPIVTGALSKKQSSILLGALEATGRLRLISAIPQVARLATSPEVSVATAAIDCLSQINDPAAVPALVELLETCRDPVRTDALAVALRRITGLLLGTDVGAWKKYLAQRAR